MVLGMQNELKRRGVKRNVILARTYLGDSYGSLGYRSFGRIDKYKGFVGKGIFHQTMEKSLK
jgi:hypothetical protein